MCKWFVGEWRSEWGTTWVGEWVREVTPIVVELFWPIAMYSCSQKTCQRTAPRRVWRLATSSGSAWSPRWVLSSATTTSTLVRMRASSSRHSLSAPTSASLSPWRTSRAALSLVRRELANQRPSGTSLAYVRFVISCYYVVNSTE